MLHRPLVIALALLAIGGVARHPTVPLHAAAGEHPVSIANQAALATTPADRSLLHSVELLRLSLGLGTHGSLAALSFAPPQLAFATHTLERGRGRGEAALRTSLQSLSIRLQI